MKEKKAEELGGYKRITIERFSGCRLEVHFPSSCVSFKKVELTKNEFKWSSRSRALGLPIIMIFDPLFNVSGIASIKKMVLLTE